MSDLYKFKTFTPFSERGSNFPPGIIRLHRTSLSLSADVVEKVGTSSWTPKDGAQRIKVIFKVSKSHKMIQLVGSMRGFTLRVRQNGTAYLNTTRVKGFGLPIGDYELFDEDDMIFRLAK